MCPCYFRISVAHSVELDEDLICSNRFACIILYRQHLNFWEYDMIQAERVGFSRNKALLTLVIVGILGFTGWHVYHARQNTNKEPSVIASSTPLVGKRQFDAKAAAKAAAKIYAGWHICNDVADGVSFKYPSDWTVSGGSSSSDPCSGFTLSTSGQKLLLQSPSSNGLAFLLWYSPAVSKASLSKDNSAGNTTSGDWQAVHYAAPIILTSGKSILLVSYEDTGTNTQSDDNRVSDMGLSSQPYTMKQTFHSFEGITSPKNSKYCVNMYASLATPNSQEVQSHALAEYQSQPAYNELMNVFKSVTY